VSNNFVCSLFFFIFVSGKNILFTMRKLLLTFLLLSLPLFYASAQSPLYDGKNMYSEERCAVMMDGKWGFIDKDGKQVIDMQYQDAMDFIGGLAAVKRNSKWGFINRSGHTVVPFIYEEVQPFSSSGLAAVKLNGKWGFVDMNHIVVVPFEYDDVSSFTFGIARAKKGEKWGFIKPDGQVAIAFDYDWVGMPEYQSIIVERGNRRLFIDHTGRTLQEIRPDAGIVKEKKGFFPFKRRKYKLKVTR